MPGKITPTSTFSSDKGDEMSERKDEAVWRNWSLKSIAGFRELLEKIRAHCPEAETEALRCIYNLSEMDKRIRAAQPVQEVRETHRPCKRIYVR